MAGFCIVSLLKLQSDNNWIVLPWLILVIMSMVPRSPVVSPLFPYSTGSSNFDVHPFRSETKKNQRCIRSETNRATSKWNFQDSITEELIQKALKPKNFSRRFGKLILVSQPQTLLLKSKRRLVLAQYFAP